MRQVSMPSAVTVAASMCVGLSLFVSGPVLAQSQLAPPIVHNYGENETPRSAAMGGALRAAGSGTTSIFVNPAALPEVRLYHFEALAQVTPETDRQVYGGTVVDSITSRLAGGFSLVGGFMDRDGLDRSFLDARLALAFPITERFMIGLTGRYFKATQSGLGPFGWSAVSGGLVDPGSTSTPRGRVAMVNTPSLDAGIVIAPTDNILIGVAGQNITYPNNGLLPTTIGGGLAYKGGALTIEADGVADINSWLKPTARIGVGGEYIIVGRVPVRLGYRYDSGGKLSTLSLGTGFISTSFSVEATVRRSLSNPGETGMVFSVAYFLESSGLTKSPAGAPSEASSSTAQ